MKKKLALRDWLLAVTFIPLMVALLVLGGLQWKGVLILPGNGGAIL